MSRVLKARELSILAIVRILNRVSSDSILLGVAKLFLDKIIIIEDNISRFNLIMNIVISVGLLLPLFISLTIALWHIRPKMGKVSNSGRPNHRSSNGIRHFENAAAYGSIRRIN